MTRRLWITAALAWVPAGVLVVTRAAWASGLPGRLPTHWSGLGRPDGFTPATAFWLTLLAVAVAAAAAASITALVERRRAGLAFAGAAALTGMITAVWLASATAGLADGRLGWRLLWFGAGLVWGVLAFAAAGRANLPGHRAADPVEPLDLRPSERAAWSTTLHSPVLNAVTIAAAAVLAVVAATVTPAVWPAVAVPLLAGAVFGRVRVTADRRGLRLAAGLIGLPIRRVRLDDIETAETTVIEPMAWGGWGYRFSSPGRSALVLRRGPGLVLRLRGGRSFAVTMDDPRTPAALLNALHGRA